MKSTQPTGPHIQNGLLCGNCTGSGMDGSLEVCKPCRGTGVQYEKIFSVSDLREVEKQVIQEQITYSRMVEILNQKATEYFYKWIREQVKGPVSRIVELRDTLDALLSDPSNPENVEKAKEVIKDNQTIE